MCGRFSLAVTDWAALLPQFGFDSMDFYYAPRYNIAPTTEVPVVFFADRQRTLQTMRWGLIPPWSDSFTSRYATHLARTESVLEKRLYSRLVGRQRAVLLADGFYEWQTGSRQPYRIRVQGEEVFALAAVYDVWRGADGGERASCSILTRPANAWMAHIHDRMPAVLRASQVDAWLRPDCTDASEMQQFALHYDMPELYAYPVSGRIGNVRVDDAECFVPLKDDASRMGGQ
jgi:putative SOS response-associated peptidase YedK